MRTISLRWRVWVCVWLAWGMAEVRMARGSVGLLEFTRAQRERRYEKVPREVLAFYYTWYGRPERQGRWLHWGRVDAERHEISESTHYPALGAYDSQDPEVMDRHIDQARQHGLTGFIATWWGQGTYDDRALVTLLERAQRKDFKVTVYWETAPGQGEAQVEQAVRDLVYVVKRHGSSPAFLKVEGKPVVFVYGRVMGQVPLRAWPAIVRRAREKAGDFLLIADGYEQSYARLFDGIHTYNICGWVRNKPPEELRRLSAESFAAAVRLAKSQARISCLTVIPGYDDTKIRRPGLRADRQGGETYRVLWEEALRADPDWVLVTSWNEWHEGSEIEPSWEDGERYLELTEPYARRFRGSGVSRAPIPASAMLIDAENARIVQGLYRGRTVGLLPEAGGDVALWLLDAGLQLKELEWADLLDPAQFNPDRFALVVHAGGEHYLRTVRREGDVQRALQRYLAAGGFVAVMPHLPFPFYYDNATGRPSPIAAHLGIPIPGSGPVRQEVPGGQGLVGGWEQPPKGVTLRFEFNREAMPGLPSAAAFPSGGDLRWRPAWRALVAGEDGYVPLAELRDEEGKLYGDGMVYIQHRSDPLRGGQTLYVWMRMADVVGLDPLCQAVFRFVAGKLGHKGE